MQILRGVKVENCGNISHDSRVMLAIGDRRRLTSIVSG